MTDRELMQQALEALVIAEAALADIGDADREPGDDLAWCEARAAQALAIPRQAIATLRERLAQPVQKSVAHCEAGPEHCPVCLKESSPAQQPEQEPGFFGQLHKIFGGN